MKIGVVGCKGFVGEAVCELFKTSDEVELVEYDNGKKYGTPIGTREAINDCDIVFVCVPSPMKEDGSCDTSIVDEVVRWINGPIIVIKSTVPPGTTDWLRVKYGKNIVHNPEFLTEANYIDDIKNANRTVLGGEEYICDMVVVAYQKVYSDEMIYVITDSSTSELSKYALNTFLATKVAYFNELKNIADVFSVNFDELREIVLLDKRIGDSHTEVTKERGFGGHCFPKDLNGLINACFDVEYSPNLLMEVWESNRDCREEFKDEKYNFYNKDENEIFS